VAPPARPYSALMLLVTTLNCATASGGGCITWLEKPWLLVPYALLSTPSSRKLLNVLRSPFTLKEPSRTVEALPVLRADRRTPVVSRASAEYSRPFSGSATACSWVITWPRWLESFSSVLTSAVTTTSSLTDPGASTMSTRCREPMLTFSWSTAAVVKPVSSPVTL
jgi:hypothetical protein